MITSGPAPAPPPLVQAFRPGQGADFVVADTLPELVAGMNGLTDEHPLDSAEVERQVRARDRG